MGIKELRTQNELLDLFCTLVEIPSPSKHEDKVIEKIREFCIQNGINCTLDEYKNVYLNIPPTDTAKRPIMFSAHMDVVGDASVINLILDGAYIKADGRTLGADDKAGVSAILYLAKEIINSKGLAHGGFEAVFTRDEETAMSGIRHVDFSKLKSKYVLVCDADKLGQIQIAGAGYTNAKLSVTGLIGGHSGIDIGDKTRLNAAKLIAEILAEFPQGVYYEDETGVITSCNLGAIIAGGLQNAVKTLIDEGINSSDYLTEIINRAPTNIINTGAKASYSIRSANVQKEDELKKIMLDITDKFNIKYKNLAKAELIFEIHLPPFEKSNDDYIPDLHTKVCRKLGIKNEVSAFHAGAETHIYAHNKNSKNEVFVPFLLGLADVYNMHSDKEKVKYDTLLSGYSIIKELFKEYNA